MVLMGCVFILLGVGGIVGSTFGSSGLAWILSRLKRGAVFSEDHLIEFTSDFRPPLSIDILVAARDEEEMIVETLRSVANERDRFLGGFSGQIKIRVGADHCTDATEERVLQWMNAEHRGDIGVLKNPKSPGKWNVLEYLVSESSAEWVALVDVGASWEPGLLLKSLPHLLNTQVTGVAPSYGPVSGGLLERLTWGLERRLKVLEASAGGPISVHGSTVFYRRAHLVQAYASLKAEFPGAAWLNDDVVLPLMLRIQSPRHRIAYLTRKNGRAWVRDYGVGQKGKGESGRRRRIAMGNLQWMKTLYGRALGSSAILGLIASRRVFRAFWSYWLLCGMIGVALLAGALFNGSLSGSLLVLAALLSLSLLKLQGSAERLRAAFWVGLGLPLYWLISEENSSEEVWN